jgi:hypothetical protein
MLPLLLSCAGASPTQLAGCPIGPVRGAPFAAAVPIPAGGDAARGGRLFEAECADDGYLGTVISAGGAAVGLDDAMKPFGQRLTPAGIADLVAYLRAAPAQP